MAAACICFDFAGAGTRQTWSQLKKTHFFLSVCVWSAPILRGPNVQQGKASLTVCATVRMAMMLSVGVSLTGATHAGLQPPWGRRGPERHWASYTEGKVVQQEVQDDIKSKHWGDSRKRERVRPVRHRVCVLVLAINCLFSSPRAVLTCEVKCKRSIFKCSLQQGENSCKHLEKPKISSFIYSTFTGSKQTNAWMLPSFSKS